MLCSSTSLYSVSYPDKSNTRDASSGGSPRRTSARLARRGPAHGGFMARRPAACWGVPRGSSAQKKKRRKRRHGTFTHPHLFCCPEAIKESRNIDDRPCPAFHSVSCITRFSSFFNTIVCCPEHHPQTHAPRLCSRVYYGGRPQGAGGHAGRQGLPGAPLP